MTNATIRTEHNDFFDGLSAVTAERRARELRSEALIGFFGRLSARIKGVFAGLGAAIRHRRLVNELSQLDDRLLADVGLSRETLSADLARGRQPGPAFFAAPMTGKALLFSAVARKVPANSDVETERRAA